MRARDGIEMHSRLRAYGRKRVLVRVAPGHDNSKTTSVPAWEERPLLPSGRGALLKPSSLALHRGRGS